jgi:hypothetical protein
LQLPAFSINDYDTMIELEDRIINGLGDLGHVNGHDAGSGEMNIFVSTDHPALAFDRIKLLLGTGDFMPQLKAAYREVGREEFNVLHPADLNHFSIA